MESISQNKEKIKPEKMEKGSEMSIFRRYWFFLTIVFLTATLSFALGRIVAIEESRPPLSIEQPNEEEILDKGGGEVVGSENSNIYHLPWCSGAQNISEENKIYFSSNKEAEDAGYRPAENCPGI